MPSSIELRKAGYAEMVYVARNMRPLDRRELYAFDHSENPENWARELSRFDRFHWVACIGWRPVTIVSAIERSPTLWHVGMYSTPDWPKVALNCTLFFRHVIYPTLEKLECNRAECRSYIGHEEAHRWLALLGAERECVMHDIGYKRDSYVQFSWTRAALERKNKWTKCR